eukprot:gene5910-7377_t
MFSGKPPAWLTTPESYPSFVKSLIAYRGHDEAGMPEGDTQPAMPMLMMMIMMMMMMMLMMMMLMAMMMVMMMVDAMIHL